MDVAGRIGFIGLGTMGEAMALTLVKAGRRFLVWNRTRARAETLAAAGADVAPEAADVFAHCATVFLMLVDGEAIDAVLDRGGAAFATRVMGRTVVHMGTTSPAYSRELEADIRSVGGRQVRLDARVLFGCDFHPRSISLSVNRPWLLITDAAGRGDVIGSACR